MKTFRFLIGIKTTLQLMGNCHLHAYSGLLVYLRNKSRLVNRQPKLHKTNIKPYKKKWSKLLENVGTLIFLDVQLH